MKYFLHDTNAMQNESVTKVFIRHGYEGVGLYYAILERLAFQEQPVETAVLKKQLFVSKKLEKVWTFLEEVQLIFQRDGKTFNEEILNVAEKYLVKKEKARKKVSEWRAAKGESEIVTGNGEVTDEVRNHSKEKKINENKINDDYVVVATPKTTVVDSYPSNSDALSACKSNVLKDLKFVSEFERLGMDAAILSGWLDAFNRWLVFRSDTAKSERDYRSHFSNWISKRAYSTMKPEDYSPVSEGKASALRAEPVTTKAPTADEILRQRYGEKYGGI